LVLATIAALLCGCASTPARPLDPATTAAALERRRLDDPALGGFLAGMRPGRPADAAWDMDSLTLAAVYFHPDLDIAYAKLQGAEAGVTTAAQRPNPTIDLSAQYALNSTFESPLTVGPAINFLIETFGKRGLRIEQARASVKAARADVQTASWQVRGRVRTAMIDLWSAQQRRAEAVQRLGHETELVTLLEHREAIGDASALDVARERANRDQFALAVQVADNATAAARADLAAAIGVPVMALDTASIDLENLARAAKGALPATDLAGLRQRALTGRSDVRAGLANYTAADAALRLQLAGRYPNVTLGPSYSYDQGQHKFGLSAASIELPIFNQNQGPIAQAAAYRQDAAATFLGLQAAVLAAVDAATTAEQGGQASLASALDLERGQQARQDRTARIFQAGEMNRPALLAGQIEVDAARLARTDAAAAYVRALGKIEDAVQQPVLSAGVDFDTVGAVNGPNRENRP
jgi:outer membrane protein TolC